MISFSFRIGREFHAYDYGPEGNRIHYGQDEPLAYDLGRVTPPTYIFWSRADVYATEEDVKWVEARLGNVVGSYLVPDSYGHFDFLTADTVNELVNWPILARMPPPFCRC